MEWSLTTGIAFTLRTSVSRVEGEKVFHVAMDFHRR